MGVFNDVTIQPQPRASAMPGDNRGVYQYSGDRAGRGFGLAGAIFSDIMDNCEVLCGLRMYQ